MVKAGHNLKSPSKTTGPEVRKTRLYQEFRAELREIHRHKWFLSENAKQDVGFDAALVDWVTRHRAAWLQAHRPARQSAA